MCLWPLVKVWFREEHFVVDRNTLIQFGILIKHHESLLDFRLGSKIVTMLNFGYWHHV